MGRGVPAGVPRRLVQVAAQSTGELWGDFTIDWLQTRRLTWQVDVEPKKSITSAGRHVQVGQPERDAICPVHAREVG